MAGMEQLEIHSKSYLVRWVKVEEGNTISWSVQPHKKSINFGIVKHPGTGSSSSSSLKPTHPSEDTLSSNAPDGNPEPTKTRRPSSARNDSSTAQDQLKAKGFIKVQWYGKCEADKVAMGTYTVAAGQSGMYGMVFDNTFSKALSKTATFVLLTYPTNAPPNATQHLHNLQATPSGMASVVSMGAKPSSPRLGATAAESVDSLHSQSVTSKGDSLPGRGEADIGIATYHVGVLMKRRRKKGQGYARRYFSLDFMSCTLSYYYNRNSSALRGAIPLSLAAIAADERRREISIDSGAEIWHLKAANPKDFNDWTKALESASNAARNIAQEDPSTPAGLKIRTSGLHHSLLGANPEEEMEWEQVESLVSRIVGTRDAVRRLTKQTKAANRQSWAAFGPSTGSSPLQDENNDYFGPGEKRSFWKRKSSASMPRLFDRATSDRNISGQLVAPVSTMVTTISANGTPASPFRKPQHVVQEEHSMHEHCAALLNDLDAVIQDFSTLIASSKRRRIPAPKSAISRRSMDSTSTGEFYDAEGGDVDSSQLILVNRQSGEDTPDSDGEDEFVSDDATSVSSNAEDAKISQAGATAAFFPPKPKSFAPLPVSGPIKRRSTLKPVTVAPPSLISFLRKNVGKDLSTISMPVSANEPTSALQRLAENLEYSKLLDIAAQHSNPSHRHAHVAAFAISYFSCGRARERANRKPFNPMLGETFELVRGEAETPGNYRFIAEKVSHRPVKLACQADSPYWTFAHSQAPTQKFWGKSAELITEGRVHVVLRLQDGKDECYSWNIATVFLRNVVMGEKYVEPVGTMSVVNETSGYIANVEFKSKGMFGGRSEDVGVEIYDDTGSRTGFGLTGTWTQSLRILDASKGAGPEIWRVGNLIAGSESRYGLTEFAVTLNEITEVEKGKMAITDTRLRVDQRAVEDGDLDKAEEWKAKLETEQRNRRKEMEARGGEWQPRWFVKAEGSGKNDESKNDECWRLKTGKDGYWDERTRGSWTGVEDVLCVNKP